MRTRLQSEGRSVPLGEKWFTRAYAVPILMPGAVLRWIQAKSDVSHPSGGLPTRLLRVRTVMEMEFVK